MASEVGKSITTLCTIETRIGRTVVNVNFTLAPSESRRAVTRIGGLKVVTLCSIFAGIGETLINLDITMESVPSGSTVTQVTSCSVSADSVVANIRVFCALVDVGLARVSHESRATVASCIPETVNTRCSIQTLDFGTMVDLYGTVFTSESDRTLTPVCSNQVYTNLSFGTLDADAVVDLLFTVDARVPIFAVTDKQGRSVIGCTGSSIQTRVGGTRIIRLGCSFDFNSRRDFGGDGYFHRYGILCCDGYFRS
jgi:hypothetical protein